jgi:hypothetical protein
VVTIPIETGETIIVKMKSTTYTIVDGTTVTSDSGSVTGESVRSGPSGYSGTGSIGSTETGVWKNTTATSGKRHTTKTSTITSESTTNIDGYITAWSWTAASEELAAATGAVEPRGMLGQAECEGCGRDIEEARTRANTLPGEEPEEDSTECEECGKGTGSH